MDGNGIRGKERGNLGSIQGKSIPFQTHLSSWLQARKINQTKKKCRSIVISITCVDFLDAATVLKAHHGLFFSFHITMVTNIQVRLP